ncbi:hypothetical protein E5676_scaffold655G00620 [Cucumis melo var. makuwa]|uniref:Uncharacterized protein n=2 Tax=Cucumis melo TaxID=3656 RepID=A0A5D3E0N0_CUCMM|nr:hypothetical protein E6C27_scaffold46G00620 [Cucumis melo var. makuwa]TYK29466.1 hypothetical protein E5676_scaffold655G00620 [Cucumis melo var. makuwa]
MKSMNRNIGAAATMMVMMLLIATVVESASPTEKMIKLVTDHHAAGSFPRKMMRNGKGNGVCPITGWPCNPAYGCGPFSDSCACYTAGHCGDFVG